MNKLKIGDIVYIAEVDEIFEMTMIIENSYCFRNGMELSFENKIIAHEHIGFGFIIKLELC